jgi:AraC-like DNA-binding protein
MLLLDVLIRYPAVALMLLLAALAIRDGRKSNAALFSALLSISAACLLLGTAHPDLILPQPAHLIVRLIDTTTVPLVWWFGLSLFEDDFSLGWLEWTGMIVMSGLHINYRLIELGLDSYMPWIGGVTILIISMAMMAHLFYVTIVGRHDDVIESRRRARFFFVIALILVTITIIISDRLFYLEFPQGLSVFRAALCLPLVIWGFFWLTRFHPETISFQQVKIPAISEPEIDPRDKLLHQNLVEAMQNKQAFAEAGLTIRILAENLKTPEHRLRALINQGMGYRNFSSFLNTYRIEAVKEAMRKPENARIPVLTLAMNVGFNSLAPFNRAFLSITGQTPTEFRASLNKKADQS